MPDRTPRTRSLSRRAALALTVALVAAACGGASEDSAGEDVVTDDLALVADDEVIEEPEPTATAEPEETESDDGVGVDPMALTFELDPSLLKRPSPTPEPTVAPSSPAPGGTAPSAPPTPVASGGNRWKYTAVLGSLGPNDVVTPAVAGAVPTAPGTAPLTGLPDSSTLGRAVVVKIDNTNAARPQIGLNQADIVYEEMVEVGITRLAAVFHSTASDTVGPVRSGRSTDIAIIDSFATPVFSNSGANSIFDKLLDKQPIVNRGAEQYGGYWRGSSRPAPHNLFTGTGTLLDGVGASTPAAHFAYRDDGEALPASARPASTVRITYSSTSYAISYEWDEGVGGWRRWQSGWAHSDSNGVQVAPENLIVQFVDYVDTGMSDKFNTVIVEGEAIGTGSALVFTDGHIIDATWTKSTLATPTTFTDASGNHIELTPGRTWVAFVPPGGANWS